MEKKTGWYKAGFEAYARNEITIEELSRLNSWEGLSVLLERKKVLVNAAVYDISKIFKRSESDTGLVEMGEGAVLDEPKPAVFQFFDRPFFCEKLAIRTKVKISPSKLFLHNSFEFFYELDRSKILQPNSNKVYGVLSSKSASRLRNAVEWCCELAIPKIYKVRRADGTFYDFHFRVTFVTVELPSSQRHSDSEITSICLNQFIVELKQKYGLNYYLWRAEKQKKGNIHYHFVTDIYIPHERLRVIWCRIINKLGYVDVYQRKQKEFYKNGFRLREDLLYKVVEGVRVDNWTADKQQAAYNAEMKKEEYNRWRLPNCTDVHTVKHIKDLAAYVSKYVCKNDFSIEDATVYKEIAILKELGDVLDFGDSYLLDYYSKRVVSCKLWYLSQSLSKISLIECVSENMDLIDEVTKIETLKTTKVKTIDENLKLLLTGKVSKLKQFTTINKLLEDKISDLRSERKRLITCKEIDFVFLNEIEQKQAFEDKSLFDGAKFFRVDLKTVFEFTSQTQRICKFEEFIFDSKKVFASVQKFNEAAISKDIYSDNSLVDIRGKFRSLISSSEVKLVFFDAIEQSQFFSNDSIRSGVKFFRVDLKKAFVYLVETHTENLVKEIDLTHDLSFTFSQKEYNALYKKKTVRVDREVNDPNIKKFCVAWFAGEPAPLLYKTFETVNLKCGKHSTPFTLVSVSIDKKTSNFIFNLKKK